MSIKRRGLSPRRRDQLLTKLAFRDSVRRGVGSMFQKNTGFMGKGSALSGTAIGVGQGTGAIDTLTSLGLPLAGSSLVAAANKIGTGTAGRAFASKALGSTGRL